MKKKTRKSVTKKAKRFIRKNKSVRRAVQATIVIGAIALLAGICSHFGDN